MVFIEMGNVILEPEYLDRIYSQWRIQDHNQFDPDCAPSYYQHKTYQHQYRDGFFNQRFEAWLFDKGFTVIQRDKKRYLKFSGDEKRLTWFLLKHGVTA